MCTDNNNNIQPLVCAHSHRTSHHTTGSLHSRSCVEWPYQWPGWLLAKPAACTNPLGGGPTGEHEDKGDCATDGSEQACNSFKRELLNTGCTPINKSDRRVWPWRPLSAAIPSILNMQYSSCIGTVTVLLYKGYHTKPGCNTHCVHKAVWKSACAAVVSVCRRHLGSWPLHALLEVFHLERNLQGKMHRGWGERRHEIYCVVL